MAADTTVYVDLDQVNTVLTLLRNMQTTFDAAATQLAQVSDFNSYIVGTGSAATASGTLDYNYQQLVTAISNGHNYLDGMVTTLTNIYNDAQALAGAL